MQNKGRKRKKRGNDRLIKFGIYNFMGSQNTVYGPIERSRRDSRPSTNC